MKKSMLLFLVFACFTATYAQKTVPEIKNGTVMYLSAFFQGQEVPVLLTVKQMDNGVLLNWEVDGYGEGAIEMSAKGLADGNKLFTDQPAPGTNKLGDTETWALVSKAALKSLIDTKSFLYNGTKFTLEPTQKAISVGGKELDTFHVTSEDKKVSLWILNNPSLPFLIQTEGMLLDLIVTTIK